MFFEEIRSALEAGNQVKLSGFGNFELRNKKQRPGRNPKNGQEIPISARRVVTFRPGQKLKARVEAYAGTGHRIANYPQFRVNDTSPLGKSVIYVRLNPMYYVTWEQEFPQLKPLKRRGNRRYYQRQDVILIRQNQKSAL